MYVCMYIYNIRYNISFYYIISDCIILFEGVCVATHVFWRTWARDTPSSEPTGEGGVAGADGLKIKNVSQK